MTCGADGFGGSPYPLLPLVGRRVWHVNGTPGGYARSRRPADRALAAHRGAPRTRLAGRRCRRGRDLLGKLVGQPAGLGDALGAYCAVWSCMWPGRTTAEKRVRPWWSLKVVVLSLTRTPCGPGARLGGGLGFRFRRCIPRRSRPGRRRTGLPGCAGARPRGRGRRSRRAASRMRAPRTAPETVERSTPYNAAGTACGGPVGPQVHEGRQEPVGEDQLLLAPRHSSTCGAPSLGERGLACRFPA
ncbi:hypothetical protein SNOUR_38525 [Streptomyces noursei ATCC 11455]|nr:hypothetical protein SNOUR_38525 [Streptomyces noursei ATCC 11455]